MANNAAVNALTDLLVDMRTTNVTRGLKVAVHEDWIKRLESVLDKLKADVPEEPNTSQALVQDVVAQVKAGKKR